MKKLIIIAVLLIVSLQNYAQFDLGIKAGYTTSKLSTNLSDVKEDIKNNFQIGAFARIGKRLFLQPEFYYATSGGTLSDTNNQQEKITFNNLCIPALLGFKLINGEKINLRIMAGPVANFIVNKKFNGDLLQVNDSDFKNVAWGLDAGAGVDIWFLTLDVRYEWGLNDIYNAATGDGTIKSNLFIVSVGFKIL